MVYKWQLDSTLSLFRSLHNINIRVIIIIIIIINISLLFSVTIICILHSDQFSPSQSNSVQSSPVHFPQSPAPLLLLPHSTVSYQHKKTTELGGGGALWGNCHNCHLVSSVDITVRENLMFGNTAFVF